MRTALLTCALLALFIAFPAPAHAQGAVLPTMSYYAPSQFADVVCPLKVGSNTEPVYGFLSFDSSTGLHCRANGRDQFTIPYNSVKALVFEPRVHEPQSALSRYKVCRSNRLTILYTDRDGKQAKTSVWIPTSDWQLALAVASTKTGVPVDRSLHDSW